jgi:hypothetical protein
MKKFTAIALCLCFLFSLAACGSEDSTQKDITALVHDNEALILESVAEIESMDRLPFVISSTQYGLFPDTEKDGITGLYKVFVSPEIGGPPHSYEGFESETLEKLLALEGLEYIFIDTSVYPKIQFCFPADFKEKDSINQGFYYVKTPEEAEWSTNPKWVEADSGWESENAASGWFSRVEPITDHLFYFYTKTPLDMNPSSQ